MYTRSPASPWRNSVSPGPSVRGSGGSGLCRRARRELDDAVGERQQALVVRRDDDDAAGLGEVAEEAQHALDLDVVEVRGRFVGDDQWRVERDGAGDRHALLLASRQVTGPVVHPVAEVDLLEQLLRLAACLPARDAAAAERDDDVVASREARDEVERLEDDADGVASVLGERLAAQRRHLRVADHDRPRRRAQDRRERGQERRLAAAARAEQEHELAVGEGQAHLVDRAHGVAAARVLDREVADLDVGHQAPANARAGSVVSARRAPIRLASSPTRMAMPNSCTNDAVSSSAGKGKPSPTTRATPTESMAATIERKSDWSASPPTMTRFADPVALSTAKSRVRSSALRYTMEPMIPIATIQSRTLMMLIVWTPGFVMRFRSEMTASLLSVERLSGSLSRMAAYDDGHREILPVEGELLRVSDVEEHRRCAEVVAELVTDADDAEVLATQRETIADRESERLVDDGLPGPAHGAVRCRPVVCRVRRAGSRRR